MWMGRTCVALALALAASGAVAAPPAVPGQVTYQAVLFDDQGQPRSGLVELRFRVYDAVTGGTLVWLQSFSDVPLQDGVFTVQLGPTGSSTDTPTDPLVTNLADALASDLPGAGGSRFLELTVGSEGALARTPVLAVPYAMRATSAASADVAALATLAESSLDAVSIAGVPAEVVAQSFAYGNHDGVGPINSDPLEGFVDTDGDGIMNFADPDNDGDGLDDSVELAQGTGVNLVTPIITGVDPIQAPSTTPTLVTVSGANFDAGQTVLFGTEMPPAQNVSPTSFQVQVGPSIPLVADLRVTLQNGETALAPGAFTFGSPQVFSTHQLSQTFATTLSFAVSGVSRVAIGGRGEYLVYPGGDADTKETFALVTEGSNVSGNQGQLAIGTDAQDRLMALRCRTSPVDSGCLVELVVDEDGDDELEGETPIPIESMVTAGASLKRIFAPSLTLDPAGRVVAAYVKKNQTPETAVVAHDRDGDGQFTGTNERVEIELVNVDLNETNLGEVVVAATGEVAYVYWDGADLRLAFDRNGDGDYADTVEGQPELTSLVTVAPDTPSCLGAAFGPDGVLSVIWGVPGSSATLARDADGSGQIGPGESQPLGGNGKACDVEGGDGLAAFDGETLYVDRNGDGDFDDADETVSLSPGADFEHAELARNSDGHLLVATETRILVDPLP